MRLGILGDIHGYVSGSNTRSIDFAVHLTATLPVAAFLLLAHGCPAGLRYGREPDYSVAARRDILDVVQPRVMFCGHAHFFREAHSNTSTVYALTQLKEEYYIFDTQDGTLERFASRSVV